MTAIGIVLQVFFLMLPAWAARIEMKNGEVYDGEILKQDAASIFVELKQNIVNLPKKQIRTLNGRTYIYTPQKTAPAKDAAVSDPVPPHLSKTPDAKISDDWLAAVNSQASSQVNPGFFQTDIVEGITIWGETVFVSQVKAALQFLKLRSYYDYENVRTYLHRIHQGAPTAFHGYEKPPHMTLQKRTALRSVPFSAAAIVHEACHARLMETYAKGQASPTGHGQESELICIQNQMDVLKKMGAADEDIKYLRDADGLHADANKDGKIDEKDRGLLLDPF